MIQELSIVLEKVDTYGATSMSTYKLYFGKYSTVAAFVSDHKQAETKKATIRFETTPGLQVQVDWKNNLTMISKHGEIFKVNIFLMVLGYSTMKYVQLNTDRDQKPLFKYMILAFRFFGVYL